MFGWVKDGVMQLPEFNLDVAFFCHLQCILDGLRDLGETRLHFFGGAQIKLIGRVAQAFALRQESLCADANQTIVGMRVRLLDVVNVVCGNELEAEFLGPREQMTIDRRLFRNAMILQFKVEVIRPEILFEPIDGGASLG